MENLIKFIKPSGLPAFNLTSNQWHGYGAETLMKSQFVVPFTEDWHNSRRYFDFKTWILQRKFDRKVLPNKIWINLGNDVSIDKTAQII